MSKTAEKSTPTKKEEQITPDKAITEIRSLRRGNLFVGNMIYVDFLLQEYDRVSAEFDKLSATQIADAPLQQELDALRLELDSVKRTLGDSEAVNMAQGVSINDLMKTLTLRERQLAALGASVDLNER